MPTSPPANAAEAVQRQQQKDAERLGERLEQIAPADLRISYTLGKSSVVLPGLLVRLITLAGLFRLNSAKKWRLALEERLLPEPVRRWLGIEHLTDLIERATVDWIPPRVFLATLSWQVVACLTQCGVPQPIAVIRQTIRDLLLGDAKPCQGGIVLDRRFWRRFAAKSARRCSVGLAEECRQRVEFVLGQVDLTETVERRWLDVPQLSEQERAKLEAARVAEPCERLQALEEAFEEGQFDFLTNLLACSYSRCGRRAHHPLLLWKIWLAMLAVGNAQPGSFLGSVDDSLQLRLCPVRLDHSPRDGPVSQDIATFAKELAAEFLERMRVFGEKFNSSTFYDPEGSAHTKRGKTVHGYGVQLLGDLKYGLIWPSAAPASSGATRPGKATAATVRFAVNARPARAHGCSVSTSIERI